MRKILSWLDNNIIAVLAGFLLVFIPLYPKWPLFDILYGYNVRVRLEDFFVAFAALILLVQLVRKKILWNWNPVSAGLVIYLIIGFLSVLTSVFVIQTVPLEYLHAGKTFLHWLRRAEYFSLFFILFASIKSPKQIKVYLILFFLTFLGVIVYGYGQKYLYWPAFSTMNREFAKGWWLYLTEHARVLSTFGGHYDLGGYLVIALTLCWSFLFGLKDKLQKFGVGLLLASGFWLLILTASRISFAGYLVGLSVVVFLWTFRRGVGWGVSRWIITVSLSILIMLSFGDLSERFLRLIKVSERFSGIRELLLKPAGAPPADRAVFLENNLAAVTSKTDQPPSLYKPGTTLAVPADVTGEEMPFLVPEKTATGATILVPRQRTYSRNAMMFDLSTGIRLDATWPRAIAGFKTNPLLGAGYATLSKANKYDYTEGESTDSDYLRALGETGFLGFAAFFGTLTVAAWLVFRHLGGVRDPVLYSLAAGFIGSTGGLLINAVTIDIFEASKVAYVFWAVAGLTLGSFYLFREKIKAEMEPLQLRFSVRESWQKLKKFLVSDFLWVVLIAVLALALRFYKLDSPIADWHSWRQADTSAVTRDFIRHKQINWLYPIYDDLSSVPSGQPNPKGFRFVEFPLYNAATVLVDRLVSDWTIEQSGRTTTALVSVAGIIFLFLLCRRFISRRVAYLAALTYSLLPYSIYYGRVILPDPSMVTASLGGLWFMSSYIFNQKKRWLVLGLTFSAAAMLIKPFAVFLLAPLIYLWFAGLGINKRSVVTFLAYCLAILLPFLVWRWWISHFPEGIPASSWLLNGDGIRFKGAFWYWLFADRIGRLILGYWGLVLFGMGIIRDMRGMREIRYRYFPLVFLLSSLSFLFVFATGNVRHDYYQILIIPALAIFVGLGLDFLFSLNFRAKTLAIICSLFALGFSWYFVRDYYNINHPEIVEAGQEVRALTDWRSLVIAPYDGDTAFLYQTDRKGWPIVERSIDYLIARGAQYYVSVRFDDLTNTLLKFSQTGNDVYFDENIRRYRLLKYTDKYTIIQLVPNKELPRQ